MFPHMTEEQVKAVSERLGESAQQPANQWAN
jgi:hypothetical protein